VANAERPSDVLGVAARADVAEGRVIHTLGG
jgi:hypothetical protein